MITKFAISVSLKYLAVFLFLFVAGGCTLNTPQSASSPSIPVEQDIASIQATEVEPVELTLSPDDILVEDKTFENGVPLAARVNEQPIFLETYQKQVAQFEQSLLAQGVDLNSENGQAQLKQIQQQVLAALIDQAIIEQEAERLGITISEDLVEAKAQESAAQGPDRTQFEAWLAANQLTYEDFKEILRVQLIANQMFEQLTSQIPETAEQIQLRQILVADEATARAIIDQLKGGADFAELAQQLSIDESSQANGGELGWFPQGIGLIPPEVEEVAFSLQPKEVSGPIPTSLGFHIIQVQDRATEHPLTIEMRQALKEQFFTNWLAERRSTSLIEKFVAS